MNWACKRIAELQAAFMLLTRLPAGTLTSYIPKLAAARWAFPIVGCVIGAIIAASYIMASQLMLPSFAAAILALIVGLLCTGAIHEDGLADCADGFGGGHHRNRKLEIMKDSAIGSYGTLALIMVMGLRILTLSSLPSKTEIIAPIVICAVISRFSMVGYLCLLPAAKSDGLGNQASGKNISSLFWTALISFIVIFMLIFIMAFIVSFEMGAAGLFYLIIALLLGASVWGIIAKHQIGGQTGDVCGAGQILCETAGWVILATIYGDF
ncbi:MAG: adenosylcobinamide-GDP ribazoletransferase [Alphaproteobacteria bacterium]|nr:adenosylcobinamide-GDP ribazoletransferase [Alphaproteobacteria bacterium]